MTIDTKREAVFPSPPDIVLAAVPDAAHREHWSRIEPVDGGIELRRTSRRMVVRAEPLDGGRSRVIAEYHIERGYYTGMGDVFDFYGREADKLLHDLWEVLRERYAAAHPLPAVLAPPMFAQGARVVAIASDGQPHRGQVSQSDGARCLVAFDQGPTEWVAAHYVHADG